MFALPATRNAARFLPICLMSLAPPRSTKASVRSAMRPSVSRARVVVRAQSIEDWLNSSSAKNFSSAAPVGGATFRISNVDHESPCQSVDASRDALSATFDG